MAKSKPSTSGPNELRISEEGMVVRLGIDLHPDLHYRFVMAVRSAIQTPQYCQAVNGAQIKSYSGNQTEVSIVFVIIGTQERCDAALNILSDIVKDVQFDIQNAPKIENTPKRPSVPTLPPTSTKNKNVKESNAQENEHKNVKPTSRYNVKPFAR